MKLKIFIVSLSVTVFISSMLLWFVYLRLAAEYSPPRDFCVKQNGVWIYNEDFTAKYKETLDVMFSGKWTVKSKTEKKVTPEPVCAHSDSTPYQYTRWEIQYYDADKKPQVFVLNNMDALSAQIQTFIEEYVAGYYEDHFYKKYLKDVPLAGASYVFCFWDDCGTNIDQHKTFDRETKEYLLSTETPKGAICFSELIPSNAFEKCPLYLSISVTAADEKMADYTKKQVIDMMKVMNTFTDGKINAEVSIGYERFYYIRGETVDKPPENSDFEEIVYESYKGIFW